MAQEASNSIGCRFVVHGVVKAETVPHEAGAFTSGAFTFCLLKTA